VRVYTINLAGQDGKYQVILKKVELPVVPNTRCQNALRRTRLGPHFKLHDSFVCAGGEAGRDTCRVSFPVDSILVSS
jgi:kallikrein